MLAPSPQSMAALPFWAVATVSAGVRRFAVVVVAVVRVGRPAVVSVTNVVELALEPTTWPSASN